MTTPISITALLLVGGESRRMGTDKAMLMIEGGPLWARQWRILRELGVGAMAVSARARPAWCAPEMEVILDGEPSRGPLSGVAAALVHMRTSHLLVLAVDLPRMTAQQLRMISGLAQPGCGVVPVRQERFEPLCAVYPQEAAALAAAAVKGNDVSLQSFVRRLQDEGMMQTIAVSPEDEELYRNVNRPEDL